MNAAQRFSYAPARVPTIYFIGVTTGQSSIVKIFPKWADALRLGPCAIVGVDLPLHAPVEDYRQVVSFIKKDALSLGALVTTHKIDLFHACRDFFDEVDPLSDLLGELSCLSKRNSKLIASAKDPITAGLALQAFLPAGHFHRTRAEAFLMGAGGSTIAITWHLTRPERGEDKPSRIVVSNRSKPRLDAMRRVYDHFGSNVAVEYVLASEARQNDSTVTQLSAGSLVVNATGLGKDAPGSPMAGTGEFPAGGYAWELNYRGDLVFLRQAQAAARRRNLTVVDGWIYFIHGWTRVIAEVFAVDIPVSGQAFDRLSDLAGGPPLLERAS